MAEQPEPSSGEPERSSGPRQPPPGPREPPPRRPEAASSAVPGDAVLVEDVVADLRLLRERGLVRIRHTDLAALRQAAARTAVVSAADAGPRAVEALLRAAVENLGGGSLGSAAAHTFGLNRGARDHSAHDRRLRAAQEYGVSVERFRKHHERVVIEQVAEEILKLCPLTPADPQGGAGPSEVASEICLEVRSWGARFPVVVHVEPVELLRDVDIVVAPANIYLEMPQLYKASVSAALQRAAAQRAADGTVVANAILDELRTWISEHGRPGLPVTPGTVAVTSAGELVQQGVRRIYHAAIASPRPGTNDYDIEPTVIAQAVRNTFAIARSERDQFSPRLNSLGIPLLGAGRGGLDPAVSFAWIWAALEREIHRDDPWSIHFITQRKATADVIVAGLAKASAESALQR